MVAMTRGSHSGARRAARAVAALTLAGLSAGLLWTANAAGDPVLCGVTKVTDQLLNCPAPSTPAGSSQSSTAPSAAPAQASTVSRAKPVSRTATTPSYVPGMLVVRFADGATQADQAALVHRLRLEPQARITDLHTRVLSVAPARLPRILAALRRSPLVAAATRDEVLHVFGALPNDANFNLQWGLKLASFPAAWQRTHGSRSAVVAVLDTGVNGSVPDLAGSVRPGIDLTGTGLTDKNGHGTAVAGVIAAHANNGVGGAGVCVCTILPVKVMGDDGKGDLATVAQGIVRATDLHARVIDMSLGGPVPLDALKQAIDYATSKGVVLVAAAGNSGLGKPFYPAGYPNVLGVAGTNAHDHLYGWSEHGIWVHVTAPGCNVAPLAPGGYGIFCGTSSATPLVAGLAALAVSLKPHATNAQVMTAIEAGARHIGTGARFGRIDAAAALTALH
jgi:subtilisin family serine protease